MPAPRGGSDGAPADSVMADTRLPSDRDPAEPPLVGITMGDPFGIGPEVLVKALADPAVRRAGRFVIYGQNQVLVDAAERVGVEPCWLRIAAGGERASRGVVAEPVVYDYDGGASPASSGGSRGPSLAGGALSKAFVDDAITDALRPAGERRRIEALVTGPISKESWSMAGHRWPGHTELLGARAKVKRQVMLFWSSKLRVALATGHIRLAEVHDCLTIGRVFDPIDLGHDTCRRLGIRSPRIAVCGLNPHAGERGLFGDDEGRVIAPAIELARRAGIDARGPFPADSIFIAAAGGAWDLVVAMYHDQGLIPLKLLARDEAVNMTAGLPFVRTSPDHGTAFDIAGLGTANPGSMKAAILLAARLAFTAREAAGGGAARDLDGRDRSGASDRSGADATHPRE